MGVVGRTEERHPVSFYDDNVARLTYAHNTPGEPLEERIKELAKSRAPLTVQRFDIYGRWDEGKILFGIDWANVKLLPSLPNTTRMEFTYRESIRLCSNNPQYVISGKPNLLIAKPNELAEGVNIQSHHHVANQHKWVGKVRFVSERKENPFYKNRGTNHA